MIETFLSCDWGTSRFRLRLVDVARGEIVAQHCSQEGVARLAGLSGEAHYRRFADVLLQHINLLSQQTDTSLAHTPVVISGMASSSMGWRELPYAPLPFSLCGSDLPLLRLDGEAGTPTRKIVLCSGVRSQNDVMRGEEVELIGLAALFPHLIHQTEDLWVVLPGTHSKHLRVRDRSIVDFHTHMTGELFQLLREHSSLRHPQTNAATSASPHDKTFRQDAFIQGVELAARTNLSESIFQVRVRQLLHGNDPGDSYSLLSGLLIGDELRNLLGRCEKRSVIILCASAELNPTYRLAVERLRVDQEVIVIPPDDVTRLTTWGQWQLLQRTLASPSQSEDSVCPDVSRSGHLSSVTRSDHP